MRSEFCKSRSARSAARHVKAGVPLPPRSRLSREGPAQPEVREQAPGARVECRIAPAFPSSVTPFGHKFGCEPPVALELITLAAERGLRPGVAFHVGSQQPDPSAWEVVR